MTKIFAADFVRMLKNRFFRIGTVFMLAAGAFFPTLNYIEMKSKDYTAVIESNLFSYTLFIIILLSVVCSIFIGTDYSDGTIRNKLIIGHTRPAVYFANLAVCSVADILMCCAYLASYLAVGIPLLGFFTIDIKYIIVTVAGIFVMTLAFISIYQLVSMLNSNKASAAVVCILGAFLLLFSGIFIESQLNEPETYSAYSYTDNTGTHSEIEQPNPNYISGKKREVYEFLYDFLPGCQALQFSGMKHEHPGSMAAYSLIVVFLMNGAGLVLFKRKDLK